MAIDLNIPNNIKRPSRQAAIEAARKELYNKSPKDNFIAIEFDYSKSIVLPYEDGLQFLSCLKNAEVLHEPYNKQASIASFDSKQFKSRVFSRKEYEDIKIAAMLGITVEELNAPEEEPLPF